MREKRICNCTGNDSSDELGQCFSQVLRKKRLKQEFHCMLFFEGIFKIECRKQSRTKVLSKDVNSTGI